MDFRPDNANTVSPEQEYTELLAEMERRQKYRKFQDYVPYEKQAEFFGFNCKVKALFGANRVGKTLSAGYEVTCHLTGIYPDWWKGRRFFRPIQARCIAVTFEQLRKVMQTELFGDIRTDFGSGMIPKELIIDKTMRQGMADTMETSWIQHISGGVSVLELMSNVQGREAFQGDAKQVIWIDEECDWDVFTENKMRTAGTGDKASGIMLVTFTPLKGWTELVTWILKETDPTFVRHITIGWDDVPHLSTEEKRTLAAGLLPHELEARSKGIPTMATGLVYPIDPKRLIVPSFELEDYDPGIIGLDVAPVGITAGMLLIKDYHSKVTYLANEHYEEGGNAALHSFAMKAKFGRYPIRIDPSSNRRADEDAKNLMKDYRVAFGDDWDIKNAYNPVYSGINRLWTAMQTGRFKVMRHCIHFIEEWQNYIWDEKKVNSDGHPVPRKKKDHGMDATRYGFWDLDIHAKPKDYRETINAGFGWKPLDSNTGY